MYDPRRAITRFALSILFAASVFQLPKSVVSQTSNSGSQRAQTVRVPFARTEAMIPMRDGVRLHTVILTPQTQTEPLAIIINRTPYGVKAWDAETLNDAYEELVADGYAFAFQDIRGKFDSEGQFVMVRPRETSATRSQPTRAPTLTTLSTGF